MKIANKTWPILVLAMILGLGMFFRFHNLDTVPPGVYPDEAKNANDAIQTLQDGDYKLFYPENNGREGLYMWMLASSFQNYGITIFGLKAVSAAIGVLTILGTYLLTRELFIQKALNDPKESRISIAPVARETIALLSAGFLAVSYWHINFSRIAFRAILVPMLLAFAIWLTLKALRPIGPSEYGISETKKLWPAILAGALWGTGLYTYIAFRIAFGIPVFLVSAAFIIYLTNNKPRLSFEWLKEMFVRDRWVNIFAMFVTMFLTMAPMLAYFASNKGAFVSRSSGISVFDDPSPIMALLRSLGLHIQMLFYHGDANWRHNFSLDPQLLLPVGMLFILGLIYSFVIMKDSIKHKNKEAIMVHLTLLVSMGAMMLPGVLTTEGVPHALRVIGMMPFVFIYAAFGFLYFLRVLFPHKHHRAEIWPFGFGSAMVMILVIASFQYGHYFNDFGKSAEAEGAFSKGYVDIGNYFNNLDNDTHKYLVINTGGVEVSHPESVRPDGRMLPMPGQTTLFIQQTKEIPIQNTSYILKDELPGLLEGKTVFVPLEANEEIKTALRQNYPTGEQIQFEYFWAWQVNTQPISEELDEE